MGTLIKLFHSVSMEALVFLADSAMDPEPRRPFIIDAARLRTLSLGAERFPIMVSWVTVTSALSTRISTAKSGLATSAGPVMGEEVQSTLSQIE